MYKSNEASISRRLVVSVYDWVGTVVVALAVFALLLSYVFRVVGVDGDSMLPTLNNEDRLLLSTFDTDYQYGDIVVVDRYTDEPLIKRVIAVGGDTLSITSSGVVSVNGAVLNEPYIQGETVLFDFPGTTKVPSGYLFVMGDNRSMSKDSRKTEIGLISIKDVVGKAVYRVWPLQSFGKIE
jgi:signal peptidase I